jgi:hypothetical protein
MDFFAAEDEKGFTNHRARSMNPHALPMDCLLGNFPLACKATLHIAGCARLRDDVL